MCFLHLDFLITDQIFYRKVSDDNEEEPEANSNSDEDEVEQEKDDDRELGQFSSIEPPIKIEGQAGKYQRAITVLEHYAAQPEYLKHIGLAQFAAYYTFKAKPPKRAVFDKDGKSILKSLNQKVFNHDIFLPKNIILQGGLGQLYPRAHPKVIRIHTS